jgi:hypothetical protein
LCAGDATDHIATWYVAGWQEPFFSDYPGKHRLSCVRHGLPFVAPLTTCGISGHCVRAWIPSKRDSPAQPSTGTNARQSYKINAVLTLVFRRESLGAIWCALPRAIWLVCPWNMRTSILLGSVSK